ncbi:MULTISPECIES: ABC transporter permease [unclassified Microbacterium]|uniref:ABC transporter permease n=1 Tax=unclassified Microbacterium TaxID=2609290 RepID=UPI00214CF5E4|nr:MULTISPECIES: ABC transporter permease [unclassified Microbacterium]MCR2783339.1 ABC transporter permease [Microbacterium sp. zg.B96]MDL5351878.1 ABC transporter permease [Microbacterium sp. zg-YB36]WIM15788.1 ABC transporter permease [Microbacterium sp. zg-B96]
MNLVGTIKSEITKQFSTSAWWILVLLLVLYVGLTAAALGYFFGASATGALSDNAPRLRPDTLPPLLYSLATAMGYVFPLLIGTLMVTTEIRHQTLTPTFLATPRRGRVLTAKLVVGVGLGVLYGVVGIVSSVAPSAAMLAMQGVNTQLGESDIWAMLARMILAFVLWVFIGIAVGALVRNQILAVVGVLVFTQFIEPIARTLVTFIEGAGEVVRFLPGAASDALVGASLFNAAAFTGGSASGNDALEWWAGGLVLLAIAAGLLALAYLFSWRRDVA